MATKGNVHPLETLPVAAVMQWSTQQEAPKPLRERIRAYIVQARGERALPIKFWAGSFLHQSGVSLDELTSCRLTMHELFGDDTGGIKASLAELKDCGAVKSVNDFMKLMPSAEDVLGPFTSKERHERLSMTTLCAVFQEDALRLIKDTFKLTPDRIVMQYGEYLYPSDFDALAMRFDGKVMRTPALLEQVRKLVQGPRMFRAFSFAEWSKAAGLTDDYLGMLTGAKDPRRIAELRQKLWPDEKKQ